MSDTPSHVHPGIRAALMVLLNHVEPGWENCKEVVQMWLDGKFEQPQERAAGSEARPHADDQRTVSQSSSIRDTPRSDAMSELMHPLHGVEAVRVVRLSRVQEIERELTLAEAKLTYLRSQRAGEMGEKLYKLEQELAERDAQLMRWFKAASPYATPTSLMLGLKVLGHDRTQIIEACADECDQYALAFLRSDVPDPENKHHRSAAKELAEHIRALKTQAETCLCLSFPHACPVHRRDEPIDSTVKPSAWD